MPAENAAAEFAVHDILYGRFVLPPYLSRLILTPEVRRLSQIRLLNSLSPSLSAISEVRRYSHTLGVLHLALRVDYSGYKDEEVKALAAAVLAHDIGTPPFGHVMEYHLVERKNWTHEGIIRDILFGTHAPENRAHQIFAGRTIDFRNTLRSVGISVDIVTEIVQKKHPLSLLLFGTLDLDNLDNVVRMATFLGVRGCAQLSVRIASHLRVTRERQLVLSRGMKSAVQLWCDLRRRVYEVLLFDPLTAASQAVLWNAIRMAFDVGLITEDDSFLTDEELLDELRRDARTKDSITLEYLGKPPDMALCLQLAGSLADVGVSTRRAAQQIIEEVLKEVFATDRVLGYVQVDSGTFEKELEFVTEAGEPWTVGKKSKSVIVYGFVHQHPRYTLCRRATRLLLERLGVPTETILRDEIARLCDHAQPALDFTSA